MQAIYSRFTAVAVCFVLVSCGGGGGSSTGSDDVSSDGNNTGYLLAPRVSGLSVNGALSRADGGYDYSDEQALDVRLGLLPISNIAARPRLSLYDLAGSAEQYRYDKAIRLGRLLISLDADADARNGVQLLDDRVTADEIDWRTTDSVWLASAESLIHRLSAGSRQLVSSDQAVHTMASHFRAESESCSASLTSGITFSIADPSCADRARMGLWLGELSAALQATQNSLGQFFSGELSTRDWWSLIQRDWQDLLQQSDETQAWLSYLLAGADVPTRRAIEDSLDVGGVFSDDLEEELERWRDGGGLNMLNRDEAERNLSKLVVQAWLSYGFDQQALRNNHGLNESSGSEAFVLAVAQQEGISPNAIRVAIVDQQVYLALQLIESMMNLHSNWVTGGTGAQLGITADDGLSSDGLNNGSDPTRVLRVSYDELNIGTRVEFTVEGSALTSDLSLVLGECSNMQVLSGNADAMRFACDLVGTEGGRTLQVIDASDGSLLYEAIVSVVGGAHDDNSHAVVTSVSPDQAQRSSTQLFSVIGHDFPNDMQFSLTGCQVPQVQFRSDTRLDVLCQLDDRESVRVGRIESSSGDEIYSFDVSPPVSDEQPFSVFGMTPAAAIEAEAQDITISGSGFGSDVEIQSSGCESTSLISSSDAEIRFRCNHAQLGTWPVHVISSQQSVQVPQSLQVRSLETTVSRVSPLQGVEGEWVNLQISGQFLSDSVDVEMSACSDIEPLDSTTVLRQYGCTLDAPGVYEGQVLAAGKVLYSFDFNVQAKTSSTAIQAFPTDSVYGEPLNLTITGTDLPELAELTLPSCNDIALLSATASEMQFSCTPQQVGVLHGELVDPEQGVLLSFDVDIVDGRDPLEDVLLESVSPEITYLEALTTFTVRGENLPASLALSVEGCTAVETLGGTDRQRQFRCTPKGSSGVRQLSVYASDGGALIADFDLQVTGNELVVSDVNPAQTAIGVLTTFRVTGQNLSSAVVIQLEGCDARSLTTTSSELRSYRCEPYGSPGSRTLRVLDRSGGSVLFSRVVDILPAP